MDMYDQWSQTRDMAVGMQPPKIALHGKLYRYLIRDIARHAAAVYQRTWVYTHDQWSQTGDMVAGLQPGTFAVHGNLYRYLIRDIDMACCSYVPENVNVFV